MERTTYGQLDLGLRAGLKGNQRLRIALNELAITAINPTFGPFQAKKRETWNQLDTSFKKTTNTIYWKLPKVVDVLILLEFLMGCFGDFLGVQKCHNNN